MSHKRVAILISGGGSNMVTLVNSMTGDHPARAVCVISNNPAAGGLAKAAALGIETSVVNHRDFNKDRRAFEAALAKKLHEAKPDIICLAGFMRILGPEFVPEFEGKILNIHPSLLPKYKGLHTHARAIEAGDTEAGCSVHVVSAELDAGKVLGQARVPVETRDTVESLAARVLGFEHKLYPAVLEQFAQGDETPISLA